MRGKKIIRKNKVKIVKMLNTVFIFTIILALAGLVIAQLNGNNEEVFQLDQELTNAGYDLFYISIKGGQF